MFEAGLGLSTDPSTNQITPKRSKAKKEKSFAKELNESINLIDPNVLKSR